MKAPAKGAGADRGYLQFNRYGDEGLDAGMNTQSLVL